MNALNRIRVIITQFEEEAVLCADQLEGWRVLLGSAQTPAAVKAAESAIATWRERVEAALEAADMLRDLNRRYTLMGLKLGRCICPPNATDESCPVCVPGDTGDWLDKARAYCANDPTADKDVSGDWVDKLLKDVELRAKAGRSPEDEARIKATVSALDLVLADMKAKGLGEGKGGTGEVKCPNCGDGRLMYAVAACNGHVYGCCTTPGCTQWMQ